MEKLFSFIHSLKIERGVLCFLLLSTLVFFTPTTLFAADDPGAIDTETRYEPLAPLPGLEGDVTVTEYFTTIYQIGVSIALVIAVVMFIFGGIQYMTSDSIGGKSNGRETITKALIGILLAVGSYLLLFLIGGGESVKLSFDLPDIGFVEPVTPQPGATPPENMYCQITYSRTEDPVKSGPTGLPNCPSEFWDRARPNASGTFDIMSEEELLRFYEASGYSFPEQCQVMIDPILRKRYIVNINMDQCVDVVGNKFNPGTPEQCFNSRKSETSSFSEKEYFCTVTPVNPVQQEILFKLEDGNYDDPGACYQVDVNESQKFDELRCADMGGELERFSQASGIEGTFCVKPLPEGSDYCETLEEPTFPSLSGWDDDKWDQFCDARNLQSNTNLSFEERNDLEELYEHLSILTGGGYQTSGYYTDQEYCDGPGEGRCHAGIDMSGIGVTELRAPQDGVIKILRTETMQCYSGNAKIALLVPGGPTWVYTHVHIAGGINNGDLVSAGTVIAMPSANPGYYNSDTGQCDTFDQHLHLEVWNDASCFPDEHGTNDGFYWTDSEGGSNNSCPHSGFVTDTEALASKTMCPLQAVYEGINNGTIELQF